METRTTGLEGYEKARRWDRTDSDRARRRTPPQLCHYLPRRRYGNDPYPIPPPAGRKRQRRAEAGRGSRYSEPYFARGYDIPGSRFITKPRSGVEHQRGESKKKHNNNTRWEEPRPPRSTLPLGRHGCLNVFKLASSKQRKVLL